LENIQKSKAWLILFFLLFITGCRTTAIIEQKEQTLIKEKIINSSFDIGGTAIQDTTRDAVFI